MNDIKKELLLFSEALYKGLESQLKKAERDEIVNSDGRKSTGHEGAKKGSFIYLLYDEKDTLLYVGETGTNIKNRLKRDGNGAHYVTNPTMYNETSYIKYIISKGPNELSPMERKTIEQAFTIYLKPKYYNSKHWEY